MLLTMPSARSMRQKGRTAEQRSLMIAALGVDIFDNLDRGALAQTAAGLNRWEFMLTVAPLVVTGGTGSTANPIATY